MKTEHKVIIGIVFLTLLIIVGGSYWSSSQSTSSKERLEKPLLGEKIPEMTTSHVARGKEHEPYNSNPPTSGPHYGDGTAGPGIKNEPVSDELVLHSMEHGAAVVWYREGIDQVDLDKIKEAFNNASGKKIMLARKDLDVPVALTSWGYLLKLETIDEIKIKDFIETNNDRAPEKAPV